MAMGRNTSSAKPSPPKGNWRSLLGKTRNGKQKPVKPVKQAFKGGNQGKMKVPSGFVPSMKGVQGRVRGLIADMILRGPTRKTWTRLMNKPLAAVEAVAEWIIRLMSTLIFSRNKRRTAGYPVVMLLVMSALVTSTTVRLVKVSGGFKVNVNGQEEVVTTNRFQVNNNTCHFIPQGIGNSFFRTSVEDCLFSLNDAHVTRTRCWCDEGGIRLEYATGSVSLRRKRSIDEHPSVTVNKGIPTIPVDDVWKVESWVMANKVFVGAVMAVLWYVTKSSKSVVLGTVLIVLTGVAMGDQGCYDLEKRDIVEAANGIIWADLVLEQGRCVLIKGKDKPTIKIQLDGIKIVKKELEREIALDCEQLRTESDSRCPSTQEARLAIEGNPNVTCKRGNPNRGWGDGCGLFARGSTLTCIAMDCGKETMAVYNLNTEDVVYQVEYAVVTGVNDNETAWETTLSRNAEKKDLSLQAYGEMTLDCRVMGAMTYVNHKFLEIGAEPGKGYSIDSAWLDDLSLPWRYHGGDWKELGTMVVWGEIMPASIEYGILASQRGAVETAVATTQSHKIVDSQIIMEQGHLPCRLKLDGIKVKGYTYKQCVGTVTFDSDLEVTPHGTVVSRVTYQGSDAPCKLRVAITTDPDKTNDRGGALVGGIAIVQSSGVTLTLELNIWPGEVWIKVQDERRHWVQPGSHVGNALVKIYDGMTRYVRTSSIAWEYGDAGSFFAGIPKGVHEMVSGLSGAVFGEIPKLYFMIVAGFLLWYGSNQRETIVKLGFYVVGASMIFGSFGVLGESYGCGIDTTRMVIKCGVNGEFVWQDLQWHTFGPKYRAVDESVSAWVVSLAKKNKTVCIASQSTLQANFMSAVIDDLDSVMIDTTKYVTRSVTGKSVRLYTNDTLHKQQMKADTRGYIGAWSVYAYRTIREKRDTEGTIMAMESAHPSLWDGTCDEIHTYGLQFEGFSYGYVDTAYVSLRSAKTSECETAFASAVAKNDRIIHADNAMWMDSQRVEDEFGIVDLWLQEYRECFWPKFYTVFKMEKTETELFMPPQLGGPASAANVVPGYKIQVNAPWHDIPLRVTRGYCPDTEVKVDSSCDNRGPSIKSKTATGTIKKWCCRSCELPPVKFETPTGCWYAMEIRPTRKIGTGTRYRVPAVVDTIQTVKERAGIVWTAEQSTTIEDKSLDLFYFCSLGKECNVVMENQQVQRKGRGISASDLAIGVRGGAEGAHAGDQERQRLESQVHIRVERNVGKNVRLIIEEFGRVAEKIEGLVSDVLVQINENSRVMRQELRDGISGMTAMIADITSQVTVKLSEMAARVKGTEGAINDHHNSVKEELKTIRQDDKTYFLELVSNSSRIVKRAVSDNGEAILGVLEGLNYNGTTSGTNAAVGVLEDILGAIRALNF